MKRIGGLWEKVTAFDNLYLAWRKARAGKAARPTVTRFELDLERNLLALQTALRTRTYRPGEYYLFEIYDRKPRVIAAAPFPDRVVHHALMNPVEPLLDRRLIHDCYACRVGKGVHAAVRRYQAWARRYAYVLKVDVRRYFPSIDHDILKAKLRRRIKDRNVLWLFDTLIDSAPNAGSPGVLFPGDDLVTLMERRCGLPIGNLTSQFLGNLYLDDPDHYLKEVCGVRAYLRYVDDLILLDDDKRRLWDIKGKIDEFLARERLCLHPDKVLVQPTGLGLDVLGYRVFPDRILLRRDNGYRYRRRLWAMQRDYRQGKITIHDVRASVAAWLGHTHHADSLALSWAVLYPVSFVCDFA
uniref:Retron-type reverse transcriptase n=1 Tax=Candidatus Kentrum sp. SD TaxID=2126332 RepID=A0A450YAR1_9GAMM|nr:MAG: Retron-type reverse transcriptase [Candidatus Kentron sp. SD]VFK38630.1 MAG: Retron-type reverse transcriptase [Candidatus Kentron sp. SD]